MCRRLSECGLKPKGDGLLVIAENAITGIAIAVISFAGVIAFVYADLITIPVLSIYRKYYSWKIFLYILGEPEGR